MISRRSFIMAGAGSLLTPRTGAGVLKGNATSVAVATPHVPAQSGPSTPMKPTWTAGFAGANLAIGESLDLRQFVTATNREALGFALNPGSAPIAGILTLTAEGMLTRIGHGAIAGILIDADDGT